MTKVEKIQNNIAKLEARLAKTETQKWRDDYIKKFVKNWRKFLETNPNPEMTYKSEAEAIEAAEWYMKYDIEHLQEQIQENYKKLEKAKAVEARNIERQAKREAKEKTLSEMPEILKEFQTKLAENLAEEWIKRWKKLSSMPYPEFGDRSQLAVEIIQAHYTNPEELRKDANDYAKRLVLNLFARVSEKCGNITNTSGLFINDANWIEGTALNGWVKGDKGTAYVESIMAGGYNIQCLHIRVIVH